MAEALAGCLLFFGLAGFLSSSRYITGAPYIAIDVPFKIIHVFNGLQLHALYGFLHSWMPTTGILLKIIELPLPLALWTVVRPSSGHQNPPNRRLALPAGLARPQVHAVLKLEEPLDPIRIHIIGD